MRYSLAAVAVAWVMAGWTAGDCRAQGTDGYHKNLDAAQKALADDRLRLAVAQEKVGRSVRMTPEWVEAVKAVADAQARYDAVSKAAMQSLQNSPEYKAAVAKKHEAEQRRDAVRRDANASPGQRTDAAGDVLVAAASVTKLEREVVGADPAVVEAKDALTAANAKLAALRKKIEDKYKDDKDVQAFVKQVAVDLEAVAQARKELADQEALTRNAYVPKTSTLPPAPPTITGSTPGNRTAK